LLLIGRLTDAFDLEYTAAGGEITLVWKTQQPSVLGRAPSAADDTQRAVV
jgi:hypothetical protein